MSDKRTKDDHKEQEPFLDQKGKQPLYLDNKIQKSTVRSSQISVDLDDDQSIKRKSVPNQQSYLEQADSKPNINKVLCKYVKQEKGLLALGLVSLFLGNFGTLLVPIYIGKAVDNMQNEDYDKIKGLCL